MEKDDNTHSLHIHWRRSFDYFMLFLISLNVIAFVMETVKPVHQVFGIYFEAFETVSILIFTMEYVARLWSITLHEKYAHPIYGRLRYIFTPIMFIDLLAFLPAYLPLLYTDFRVIRALRLFRLFRLLKLWRYSASLRLLIKIIMNKKEDLQVIFFTIFILLIISSSLMYMIECENQPEKFASIPETMWWAVSALTTVGYGDIYPKTAIGKILGSFIALLGIGLFALPAGIISAGFMQEVDQNNRKNINKSNSEKIKKAFHASPLTIGEVPVTHRVIDLITLKSRLELSEQDIFDAIKNHSGLRVRYKKNTPSERFSNTVALEHFEFNRSYGSYLNRYSSITIVSPMSYAENAVGHFTAHLAKYLKADYLSNELYGENNDLNTEFAFSFSVNEAYLYDDYPDAPQAFLDFKADLQQVIQSNEKLFIIKSISQVEEEFILHFGGKIGEKGFDIAHSTFREIGQLQEFYSSLETNLQAKGLYYRFTTHRYFDNTLPNTIHQYIWQNSEANVITLYINNDLMEWADDTTYYQIIQTVGDTIRRVFG